jgi:hypothetical protein
LLDNRLWTWMHDMHVFNLTDIPQSRKLSHTWLMSNRYVLDNTIDQTKPGQYAELNRWDEIPPKEIYRDKLAKARSAHNTIYGNPQEGTFIFHENFNTPQRYDGWSPIANYIYDHTAISAYVETISIDCEARSITEKTYDPLIKGHAILPWGYAGLIDDITDMGFKLMPWINYEYNKPGNIDVRWDMYVAEMQRLDAITHVDMQILMSEHHALLEHNRNIFFVKPYDSLYDKVFYIINTA